MRRFSCIRVPAIALLACGLWAGALTHAASRKPDLQEQVVALQARLQQIEDREAVEKLTRAYGYYVDKGQWGEIIDLFADDGRVEIAGRGVYIGKRSVDTFFRNALGQGKNGLADGMLFNHLILQGIVDVAPDGRTAQGRWQVFAQVGKYQQFGVWAEGIFANRYVKEGGVWKFAEMHYYATFYTPYADGWGKTALPNNGPSKEFPPDAPQSVQYDVYPGQYVPPYHYPNPVTGKPWAPAERAVGDGK
ncbi:MAG: nuclear transport factor 2 family protein [Gammaproteobacteria bacterium]|nr:nuclear transport factor 2 family protein [Gammaproteobacteria bacterium]